MMPEASHVYRKETSESDSTPAGVACSPEQHFL